MTSESGSFDVGNRVIVRVETVIVRVETVIVRVNKAIVRVNKAIVRAWTFYQGMHLGRYPGRTYYQGRP